MLEIVKREAFGTSIDAWSNHVKRRGSSAVVEGAVSGITRRYEVYVRGGTLARRWSASVGLCWRQKSGGKVVWLRLDV